MFFNKPVIVSLFFSLLLSGCGGSDDFKVGFNGEDNGNTTTAPVTDPVTGEPVTTPTVVLALGTGSGSSFAAGAMTTSISGSTLSFAGNTTLTVNVVDTNASNASFLTPTTVLFSSACATSGLATIGASSVSSNGTATINYTATSCAGSDTVTATLSTGATASVTFSISSLELGTGSDGSFSSGAMTTTIGSGSDLSFGGDTGVSVNIVDSNGNALFIGGTVTVNFTSNCVQNGFSTITDSVNTSNGTATATYSANTCSGTDTITATLSDGASASVNITVADQVLGALEFVSASPATLALSGSGSSANPEVSTVSFSLKDQTGAAMAGETINYVLSTSVGGITLSSASSVTDAGGLTSVQLNAGGVNVSVIVIASVTVMSGATTTTTSDPIAILGGIPDQNSFSISATTFNPRGFNFEGTTVPITIRAADRFNNQARDGTQISFITSGGAIVGSCALSGGACSVNWTSQNPRPVNIGAGANDGLVQILARTTGEEAFTDSNSNGKYDVGEPILTQLDEAFSDDNFNGVWNAGEFFSDFNNNGVFNAKSGTNFQGTNCTTAAETAGHCANLVDVRASLKLAMSTDGVTVTDNLGGLPIDVSGGSQLVGLTFSDLNGNSPSVGTTFSTEVNNGEILSGGTIVVPNQSSNFTHFIQVDADDDLTTGDGDLKVTVTQVNGAAFTKIMVLCSKGITGSACTP